MFCNFLSLAAFRFFPLIINEWGGKGDAVEDRTGFKKLIYQLAGSQRENGQWDAFGDRIANRLFSRLRTGLADGRGCARARSTQLLDTSETSVVEAQMGRYACDSECRTHACSEKRVKEGQCSLAPRLVSRSRVPIQFSRGYKLGVNAV